MYDYKANLKRVIDGDTIEVTLDVGFHSYRVERLRLLGIDCPEMTGDTKQAGEAAKAYTQGWLDLHRDSQYPLIVTTHKTDDFGRYLAVVSCGLDTLNNDLLSSGHAVTFMEGK